MSTEVGLFGKIPSQGDFVRLNASTPAALAFDAFLSEALEVLKRTGGELPPSPVQFAFFDAASKTGLYGVFSPSRDSVGRQYPLSVFAPLPAGIRVAAVPYPARAFVLAAVEILSAGAMLPSAELCTRARTLPAPQVPDGDAGRAQLRRSLHDTGSMWLWQTLFPDTPDEGKAYALRTLKTACEAVKGKPPSTPGVVLDCPAPNLNAVMFWLTLVEGWLGWRGASPSFFWSAGRVLIALGPPPGGMLSFLVRPESTSNKLWPLRTTVATARESAARELDPKIRQLVGDSNGSLLDVVTLMEAAP
jgi:type VI secretion system protein ImpM